MIPSWPVDLRPLPSSASDNSRYWLKEAIAEVGEGVGCSRGVLSGEKGGLGGESDHASGWDQPQQCGFKPNPTIPCQPTLHGLVGRRYGLITGGVD